MNSREEILPITSWVNLEISNSPLAKIKTYFAKFLETKANNQHKFSSGCKKGDCKEVYLVTKTFLEVFQDELTPDEKRIVLDDYIDIWVKIEGYLDIKDTEFAEEYKTAYFGKYSSSYNSRVPMLAGFNLKNIALSEFSHCDLIFPNVDFCNADFSDSTLAYGSFHNCDFTGCTVNKETNFNQCQFVLCDIQRLNLSEVGLCEASFTECLIFETKFRNLNYFSKPYIYKCININLLNADQHRLNEAYVKTAEDGSLNLVKKLLKAGADPAALNNSATVLAARNKHFNIVKFILDLNDERVDISAEEHEVIKMASSHKNLTLANKLYAWYSKHNKHLELKSLIENNQVLHRLIENYEKSEIQSMLHTLLIISRENEAKNDLYMFPHELILLILKQYNGLEYNTEEKINRLFQV